MQKTVVHLFVRIASAFLPRASRQRLRTWYKWNYCGINECWWNEVRTKHAGLAACRDSVQDLVVGSSHGAYGYQPSASSYNLCGASQDLYMSAELMRRCLSLPNLRRVILFYSVFSPGSQTEMTTERERALYYKELWGVPYRFHDGSYFQPKKNALELAKGDPLAVPSGYRGECLARNFIFQDVPIDARVATHLRENRRGTLQTRYVSEMARMAREAKVKFVVVIPPVRSDYMARMPPFDELFSELLAELRLHHDVGMISFWRDPMFEDADFGDSDHLDVRGAEKLTNLINLRLDRAEKDILPGVRLISFPVHGDRHGSLIALEKGDDFPFEIRRVYYIYGTDQTAVRGHHAHMHLEQVIVCTSGSCDFIVDDGSQRKTIHLNSPQRGLYLKNLIWREFTNFSSDCVVMVLASEHYNESDYIRNYEEFRKAAIDNG